MKVLDLFSGVGGFSLGLERAGMETVAFCEIEPYPVSVLKKNWEGIPIASDVTKLTYQDGVLYDDGREIYRGTIDVICGGFPCQDLSLAGDQKGIDAARSGLWSHCSRLLGEVRPRFAIFENVTNLLNGAGGDWFKRVLWDISQVGYDVQWHCIPASSIGAPHQRDRIWILASNTDEITNGQQHINARSRNDNSRTIPYLVNTDEAQRKGMRLAQRIQEEHTNASRTSWWETEPCVDRVANAIPNQSHRLAALGNAVVPGIPELLGRAIMNA